MGRFDTVLHAGGVGNVGCLGRLRVVGWCMCRVFRVFSFVNDLFVFHLFYFIVFTLSHACVDDSFVFFFISKQNQADDQIPSTCTRTAPWKHSA